MKSLHHVILNTGHVVHRREGDVPGADVVAASETLDGILQGGCLPVAGRPDYSVSGTHFGESFLATIWRGGMENGLRVLTTGSSREPASARPLWQMLHDFSALKLATDREAPPGRPWLAVRFEPLAWLDADAMLWTGELSRCLAWAWYRYRE